MQEDSYWLNLYPVRHGETEGNVNRALYKTKADHAMRLTAEGIKQAKEAGLFLANRLFKEYQKDPQNFGRIRVWHTPYYRGRETAYYILEALAEKFAPVVENIEDILDYREELFMFEQKAGLYDGVEDGGFDLVDPAAAADYEKHTQFHGRTYARTPLGESRMEVAERMKPHFGTILRDRDTKKVRHVIDVSHGLTVRAEVMAWMRYPPEWLDAEKNPGNCWIRYIHGSSKIGYIDEGYIHGDGTPLGNIMAMQAQRDGADQVYMLKPNRPNGIVPPGISTLDPFAKYRRLIAP